LLSLFPPAKQVHNRPAIASARIRHLIKRTLTRHAIRQFWLFLKPAMPLGELIQ
jgi:hypothetical protein